MTLPIWVIYRHPKDHPKHYVIRKWILDQPTDETYLAEDLGIARGWVRVLHRGAVRLERDPTDDPVIVESWI